MADSKIWVRIQDGRIQDDCHHQDESECMSEDFLCKVAESKMAVVNPTFKMAAIIKLSQNEWVKWFLMCKIVWIQDGRIQDVHHHWVRLNEWSFLLFELNPRDRIQIEFKMCHHEDESEMKMCKWFFLFWIQDGRIQDGCHHQVETEWLSEVFFQNGLFQDARNSRWLANIKTESEMKWMKFFFGSKMVESKMVRIQDAWHHQVEWEWMSLSQIELVWVRVRVEWGCFWVNLREDNKVFESKMAVAESNMAESKVAAIIKLGDNEWEKFFVQNVWIQDGRIQDGFHHQVEWEWMSGVFYCWKWLNPIWQNSRWQNSRWLPSSRWVRMYEWSIFFCANWLNPRLVDFKMTAIFKLSQNEWVWSQFELVWVRVRVEWECFWVNLRDDNKVFEFKMAVAESIMAELKMRNHHEVWMTDWMSEVFYCS